MMTGRDPYTMRSALLDACHLYRGAKFEATLRRDLSWREARRLIRDRDPFGGRWTARASGRAMRLTRAGLEVRFTHGVERVGWKDLQDRFQQSRN